MHLARSIIISSSPFLVSLPFTVLDINRFSQDQPRAVWQPPDYTFGIVWPILYVSLFSFNMLIFRNPNISTQIKSFVAKHTIIEAVLQGVWLYMFRFQKNINDRKNGYIKGIFPMFGLVLMSWFRLKRILDTPSILPYLLLYLPYLLWINFAHILNWQLILGFTK
jgi:tryptophan-rich sensory protein